MRMFRKSFLLCAMALPWCLSGCDQTKPRYLALGDSYTIGENVPAEARWPVQLANALKQAGIDVGEPEIIARTGWTTADLTAAIDREDPRGPFDLVTLLIGVNNEFRGRDPEEYRTQLIALLKRSIALAGDRASHVIVLSIPDWGATPFAEGNDRAAIAKSIDQFNDIARSEAKTLAVHFVDITPETRTAATQPGSLADDGLHPSATMYAAWVQAALPEAKSALKE